MRDLTKPFKALSVYVHTDGNIKLLSDLECLDWKTLEEGINDMYPDYEKIEFDTMDYDDAGKPLFYTLDNWLIQRVDSSRVLFRMVDGDEIQ